MKPHINIGATPAEEDCAQLGVTPNFAELAKRECQQFIVAIRRELGPEPEGARLCVKGFNHDFGRYYEVVCEYEEDNVRACNYAIQCESEAPTVWSDEDRKALGMDGRG